MKIKVYDIDFGVQKGDSIEIEHLECKNCGGSIGRITQKRKNVIIKEAGSAYCCG